MRAYYASKISQNMARTPEGYLICYNVPIARCGVQEYSAMELHLEKDYGEAIIPVNRSPDEVFSIAAMASFEGKPVTDEHPSEDVRPDNIIRYMKGIATNIRQGTDGDNDKVIADLIIYDPILSSEIEAGKREISCGYDCLYMQDDKGNFFQKEIRGNHIAIVTEGRAGSSVAIKDSKYTIKMVQNERRYNFMGKNKNQKSTLGILARMMPLFSKDAMPGDVADAVEALVDSVEQMNQDTEPVDVQTPAQQQETPPASVKDDDTMALLKAISEQLAGLAAKVAGLEAGKTADDPIEQLESELTGESAVTIPVEEMDEEGMLDKDTTTQENNNSAADENSVISNADRKQALSELRAIKPIIANIKDEKQRIAVTDRIAKVYRQALGVSSSDSKNSGYADILATQQEKAKKFVTDSNVNQNVNQEQIGRDIAKKYNPHYKDK